MHLVVLAGLAIGSAVFSGCANGHSTSTAGPQQNTLVKANGRYQGPRVPQTNSWVDWSKPAAEQHKYDYPEPYGLGIP